jgi:hypothetical protein
MTPKKWNSDLQPIISLLLTHGSVTSDRLVAASTELERRIPVMGITRNGFVRHCNLGHRSVMMKKFPLLILERESG